jgi:glycosyltransferase 2 family protein
MWLGVAFGIGCLALFAWNASWSAIVEVLVGADVARIVVASACLLMTSVARAWRWRYLLGSAPISFRHRLSSIFVGFAGNNVLPGRLGEPLRCWLVSRLDRRIGFWQAAGSVVVERVFDLAAVLVLLGIFVAAATFSSDSAIREAPLFARLEEQVAFGAVLLGGSIAALVLFARGRLATGAGWYGAMLDRLHALQKGSGALRSVRAIVAAVLATGALWTFMVLYEVLMLRAFGFHELGAVHAIGLLVALSFAIALPQAPAGLGVVQLTVDTTLTSLFGVPSERAKAFAIGLWVCQVTVVVGAGAVALWFEGIALADVRRARGTIDGGSVSASPE